MTVYRPMIFVFGSNLAGRHGKGAVLCARTEHGAEYGIGIGRTGNAYAIPTKDGSIRTLDMKTISGHVADFIGYARAHPELEFHVTKIGCGLAGVDLVCFCSPKRCHGDILVEIANQERYEPLRRERCTR